MASPHITRRTVIANATVAGAALVSMPAQAKPSIDDFLNRASEAEKQLYHAGQLAASLKQQYGGDWYVQNVSTPDSTDPFMVMVGRKL